MSQHVVPTKSPTTDIPSTKQIGQLLFAKTIGRPRTTDMPPASSSRRLLLQTSPHPARLSKPIVIPAFDSEAGSPFLRAYPPALADFGIPRDDFLEFIDELNRVVAPNGPIMTVGYAGGIVGLVPEPTAQIVSTSVEAAASIASEKLSQLRAELLLHGKTNPGLLGPRGLQGRVVSLSVVAEAAGIPILKSRSSGKAAVDDHKFLLPPIENAGSLRAWNKQQRRLGALEPYTSPLQTEDEQVPAVVAMESKAEPGRLSKMLAKADRIERKYEEKSVVRKRERAFDKHVERKQRALEGYERQLRELQEKEEKEKAREEEKRKQREGRNGKTSSVHVDEERAGSGPVEGRESRTSVDEEGRRSKFEAKRRKLADEYEKKMSEMESDRQRHDDEEREVRKIRFLLITNSPDGTYPIDDGRADDPTT